MKQTGIVILIIGIVITVFTGFNFVTKKKVIDIGKVEVTKNQNHTFVWSPLAGFAVMIIGGGIYLYGARKS